MKLRIFKLLFILLALLVTGCSNQSADEIENTNEDPISSEEKIDSNELSTINSIENDEIYFYICPIIMDLDTGEFKDVNALGLSDWMNIAILSTNVAIESEENLKDINGYFNLTDFRNVPYGTHEEDFNDYVVIYELIRDNDWYVWHQHTYDYEESGLSKYDYELIHEDDDYIEFSINIDNIEYYFRTNVFYTQSQLEQFN